MKLPVAKLESRYFERMGSSLGDKVRMLPWVQPGLVLDVGAGGGELSRALAELPGTHVTALDANPESIKRLRAIDGIQAFLGFADEVNDVGQVFNTIVCCSILHEVYSYGASSGEQGFDALDVTFAKLVASLAPGGRLIVRDGVMPSPGLAQMVVADPDVVDRYLALSPHPELQLAREGRTFSGTRHAVAEAALTLTWGESTFAREALERYQLFDLSGYAEYAHKFGLRTLSATSVIQPGYVTGLRDVRMSSNGQPWFPQTNALWIFEKNS